jgi:hypothetical protein
MNTLWKPKNKTAVFTGSTGGFSTGTGKVRETPQK